MIDFELKVSKIAKGDANNGFNPLYLHIPILNSFYFPAVFIRLFLIKLCNFKRLRGE